MYCNNKIKVVPDHDMKAFGGVKI